MDGYVRHLAGDSGFCYSVHQLGHLFFQERNRMYDALDQALEELDVIVNLEIFSTYAINPMTMYVVLCTYLEVSGQPKSGQQM